MIPTTEISSSTLDALFFYMALLGVLLLIATWLRLKIPILKKYYIPASLIAGVIGLILGPHFIGLIPAHITSAWSSMSGRLIVIIFAPMLMGKRKSNAKTLAKKTLAAVSWCYAGTSIQYALPILLCVFFLTPVFGVHPLFGSIGEQGWAGGHGTAGGMGIVFEELGWLDGQSLSITSATIGLVYGILMGIALINIGVRKGWTSFLKSATDMENKNEEIHLSPENRPVSARTSVESSVVDNFAFHASLIGVAVALGWVMNKALKTYLGFSVSWFVTALFAGWFLQMILNRTPWGDVVDSGTMSRISGVCLEFLVAGAVASVNVSVVVEYAVPLLVQQGALALAMLFMNIWFARRIFGKYWFEDSMIFFGTYCGVAATGLLLLKTCDPQLQSDATEVYATRAPFCSWATGGGLLTSMTPVWIMQYGALKVGLAYTALFLICICIPRLCGVWYPPNKSEA